MDMTKWCVGVSAVVVVHLIASPIFAQNQGADAQGEAARATQKLMETQEQLVKAERKAADAEAAKKTQMEVDAARRAGEAKRVIKYGVTVGAAASVQVPLFSSNKLVEPAGVTMPYVVFLPWFWGQNPGRNAYCAAEWSGPEDNALAAAALADGRLPSSLAVARRELRQREEEQTLLTQKVGKARGELKGAVEQLILQCPAAKQMGIENAGNSVARVEIDKVCSSSAVLVNRFDVARRNFGERSRELEIANRAVRVAKDAVKDVACWPHKVGLYVGYPVTFKATTDIKRGTAKDVSKRDVSPVISLGIAVVPNAVVTILAGATLATAPRDDGTSAVVGSLAFGIGANADLVNVIP
jgi:hypothetical protein